MQISLFVRIPDKNSLSCMGKNPLIAANFGLSTTIRKTTPVQSSYEKETAKIISEKIWRKQEIKVFRQSLQNLFGLIPELSNF